AHGGWRRLSTHLGQIGRATWGMTLAHAGVAVFIIGVTMVKGYEVEKDVRVHAGETVTMAGFQFRFDGTRDLAGPNYQAVQAGVSVTRDGAPVAFLAPEKRVYRVQQNPMTEAAIDPGFTRDLYVALGEPLPDGGWTLRVYVKPFVDWIWGGCLLMALGGALAASDARYRRRRRAAQPAPAAMPLKEELA
ncbi:cytochrome c-type biogenesis CcmF C-terminal domain-containing protein, partial [Roseateles sp.]|uniref:cytochrome c-type biogenesis CcmF C-terminal domain-containing protein n=1 Tax=Roseateles sp. TaxID=1971397 RepID=UPI002DF9708A|nr:cytochrome c-type biogenesis CcmF C-terminal domain-containing protein [Roseateles sp.]